MRVPVAVFVLDVPPAHPSAILAKRKIYERKNWALQATKIICEQRENKKIPEYKKMTGRKNKTRLHKKRLSESLNKIPNKQFNLDRWALVRS
jgi:hypothetical protein